MNPSAKTITKLLIQKGLPESIIYQIIRLFYHEEHQWRLKRCFEHIIDQAFCRLTTCSADLESAMMWFYRCNCCERHSYNKAIIRDNDLMIVTKPCVFKGWRYDCRDEPYGSCECYCRHVGRQLAREFLEKKNPENPFGVMMPNANGTHRSITLGIRGVEQEDQNQGPDPDDPAYYDYMIEHYTHLLNH